MMRIIQQNLEKHSATDYVHILKKGTRVFFIGSGALFIIYIYCVGAVTFTVLNRRASEQNLKQITSDISKEELSYLDQQKALTQDMAASLGLVQPQQVAFTAQKEAVAWNAGF